MLIFRVTLVTIKDMAIGWTRESRKNHVETKTIDKGGTRDAFNPESFLSSAQFFPNRGQSLRMKSVKKLQWMKTLMDHRKITLTV